MKACVYTCVASGYDVIAPPDLVDDRLDYHCFSDRPEAVPPPWQYQPLPYGFSGKNANRYVKILPHRQACLANYDISLYIDGNIRIVGDLMDFISRALEINADILAFDHPLRSCAYEEASACAKYGLAPYGALAAQMEGYQLAGLPKAAGLYECGVMVRRRTVQCIMAMEAWWRDYRQSSGRDQLSFAFLQWQAGAPFTSLGRSDARFENRFLRLTPHAQRSRIKRRLLTWLNQIHAKLKPSHAL